MLYCLFLAPIDDVPDIAGFTEKTTLDFRVACITVGRALWMDLVEEKKDKDKLRDHKLCDLLNKLINEFK